ncbi:MAG: hypothetical protein ACJ0O9_03480 [Flavobacteriaceae bacterium]
MLESLILDMRDDYKVFAATYGLGIYSGIFTEEDEVVVEPSLINQV